MADTQNQNPSPVTRLLARIIGGLLIAGAVLWTAYQKALDAKDAAGKGWREDQMLMAKEIIKSNEKQDSYIQEGKALSRSYDSVLLELAECHRRARAESK